MFSMCSELTPRAPIPDTRIPQLMQPWQHPSRTLVQLIGKAKYFEKLCSPVLRTLGIHDTPSLPPLQPIVNQIILV